MVETLRDGRFALTRLLAEGGQAATFEAVDKKNGMLVAVKRFRVRGASSWKEVELAEREARVLAALSHPSLPRYVDHFEEQGELYLVTEHIDGEDLAAIKRRGGRFSDADIEALLREASDALDYLHDRRPALIHRDLKPSNVIRRPDGRFVFIDFGSVRDRMKPEGGSTVVGTFGYMAPEQFQGRALPASDVYAIGATALAMLTGCEPEDLPHRGLAVDVRDALGDRSGRAPLTRVLEALLEPDPDRRPGRIAPLLSQLGDRQQTRVGNDREKRGNERSVRKADQRRRRDEQRERRRKHLGMRQRRGPTDLPPFVRVLFLFGLTIAQLAVIAALRVSVPIVLVVLSLAFGKRLRDAADAVSSAGEAATAALGRAKDIVAGKRALEQAAPTEQFVVPPASPRVRIADPPAGDSEGEEEDVEEAHPDRRRVR